MKIPPLENFPWIANVLSSLLPSSFSHAHFSKSEGMIAPASPHCFLVIKTPTLWLLASLLPSVSSPPCRSIRVFTFCSPTLILDPRAPFLIPSPWDLLPGVTCPVSALALAQRYFLPRLERGESEDGCLRFSSQGPGVPQGAVS